jgi:hypothetical protein
MAVRLFDVVNNRGSKADQPTVAERLAILLFALLVLLIGFWLLWGIWRGRPVAAAFTRVGGPTRVETAVEASRFWLTPPQRVVTTAVNASQEIMWGAARCAMVHDAPLLFTSPDPKKQRLVDATINGWGKNPTPTGPLRPQKVRNQRDVDDCLSDGDPSNTNGLSTLKVINLPLPLPEIKTRKKLAPVIVLAAAKAPRDPADIAVGSALAAHMATDDQHVSLVVVPRYLQAHPELENELRKRRELVRGGIVLGEKGILSEDTRALLRQVLTSIDRQGLLGEIRTGLGSLEGVVAALFVLLGLRTVSRETPALAHQLAERTPPERTGRNLMARFWDRLRFGRKPTTLEGVSWLADLPNDQEVTVWLHSGGRVTGTVKRDQDRTDVGTVTVLRLNGATVIREGYESKRPEKVVLVPVKDIDMINVVQRPATPEPDRPKR